MHAPSAISTIQACHSLSRSRRRPQSFAGQSYAGRPYNNSVAAAPPHSSSFGTWAHGNSSLDVASETEQHTASHGGRAARRPPGWEEDLGRSAGLLGVFAEVPSGRTLEQA